MRKTLSVALATMMLCAMTISAAAAPQVPDRICPGEIENNGVLGAQWVEHDTFVPVSTGVGNVYVVDGVETGMTAIINHVDPLYTRGAEAIGAKIGGKIVGAFDVKLPALISGAKVVFNVKDGYNMPANIVVVSMHGTKFNAPAVTKINDRQICIDLDASDNHLYIFDGGNLAAGSDIAYKDFLDGWK